MVYDQNDEIDALKIIKDKIIIILKILRYEIKFGQIFKNEKHISKIKHKNLIYKHC